MVVSLLPRAFFLLRNTFKSGVLTDSLDLSSTRKMIILWRTFIGRVGAVIMVFSVPRAMRYDMRTEWLKIGSREAAILKQTL